MICVWRHLLVCSQVTPALYERQVTTFIPLEQARCYQKTHIRSTQAFLIKFMISLSFCVDAAVLGAAPAEPDVMGIAACLKSTCCSSSLSCRHNFFWSSPRFKRKKYLYHTGWREMKSSAFALCQKTFSPKKLSFMVIQVTNYAELLSGSKYLRNI